ncbi:phytoene/squalene synthase family protein [Bacillus alkalicellulosilyticus]|uniref:phytoene/squalene synthase family protein n=1 Tax=Alkalihalobacterium alkalicellulosilyticum TaxID=1912214 RepID=UPI000996B1F5|nr:phytoene/squalene synthase family protein [Bacillus alkalicellulosilyticus]
MKEVERAYLQCKKMIESNSKTFAKAFSILPERQRKAVWAIYAFCRQVDDIVDEGSSLIEELEEFEKKTHDFFIHSIVLPEPMWIALDDVRKHFDIEPQPFFDMIKGQGMDYKKSVYDTLEEVEEYSYYVAGTVGLMLLPVLAPNNHHEIKEGAVSLGVAMQLTNILRDVGEDLLKGRIYLPKDTLVKYDYSYPQLFEQTVNKSFIGVWEELAERAETLYQKALKSVHHYPISSRVPVLGALYMYREILAAVRRNDYDVFRTRAYVTKEEKEKVLVRIQDMIQILA